MAVLSLVEAPQPMIHFDNFIVIYLQQTVFFTNEFPVINIEPLSVNKGV
jgi:hypothetical protein